MVGLSLTITTVIAQSAADTALAVKDLNKVMLFTKKPNLYYSAKNQLLSVPILQGEDTLNSTSKFYKLGNQIYFTDGRQETYITDTLMVHVNNERKQIWITKIDTSFRTGGDLLFFNEPAITKKLLAGYSIAETDGTSNISTIELVSKDDKYNDTQTIIDWAFNKQTWYPKNLSLSVTMKRAVDDADIQYLKDKGVYQASLIKTINGQKYLSRKQTMTTVFGNISTSRDKALTIPSLSDKIIFNTQTGNFEPAGIYSNYQVVKTF